MSSSTQCQVKLSLTAKLQEIKNKSCHLALSHNYINITFGPLSGKHFFTIVLFRPFESEILTLDFTLRLFVLPEHDTLNVMCS